MAQKSNSVQVKPPKTHRSKGISSNKVNFCYFCLQLLEIHRSISFQLIGHDLILCQSNLHTCRTMFHVAPTAAQTVTSQIHTLKLNDMNCSRDLPWFGNIIMTTNRQGSDSNLNMGYTRTILCSKWDRWWVSPAQNSLYMSTRSVDYLIVTLDMFGKIAR